MKVEIEQKSARSSSTFDALEIGVFFRTADGDVCQKIGVSNVSENMINWSRWATGEYLFCAGHNTLAYPVEHVSIVL